MRICFIIFLLICNQVSFTQSKGIDSLIQKFLLENKEVDTILYKEQKTRNSLSIESNYFKHRIIDIHNKKCLIVGYEFGSNSSFRGKFILIDFVNKNSHNYTFFGKDGFENDLKTLRSLFCLDGCIFVLVDKKKILQALMKTYADLLLSKGCNQNEMVL